MTRPLLVIPMTGISSRFTAAGYDRPKFLLESEGQTVLEHVLDMYPGWEDVVLVCNTIHLDDPRWNLRELILRKRPRAVIVPMEGNALGPGSAVLHARRHIDPDRPVVVNYCDFTCYWDADDFAAVLTGGDVDGLIPVYRGFHPHMAFSTSYAYPKVECGVVTDIQEKKPWTDDPQREYASSGTYGFASGRLLIEGLERQVARGYDLSGEYYVSLTYKALLEEGATVGVYEIQHFMQWGTPQDFEEYRDYSRAVAEWVQPTRVAADLDQSSVVLASGAGRRFADAGYRVPKPCLPLAGVTLLEQVERRLPGTRTVVVSRRDLDDDGEVAYATAQIGAELVELSELSRGQAESALFGLERVPADAPVTVAACDAIASVDEDAYAQVLAQLGGEGLAVWLAEPYHVARRRPEQYGWALRDRDGSILDAVLKDAPPSERYGVIIGTFTFGSAAWAREHIRALIDDEERINGEFYLDSLVARAVRTGERVVGIPVSSFVSAGTPAEYETVLYWQSCFHKWSLHPYQLTTDRHVPRDKRADLDRQFREFPLTRVGASAIR